MLLAGLLCCVLTPLWSLLFLCISLLVLEDAAALSELLLATV